MLRYSGVHTPTKVVSLGFLNYSLTFMVTCFTASIVIKKLLNTYSNGMPSMELNAPSIVGFISNSFSKPLSKIVGKFSKRNVCPVGAVSNTITLYFISYTLFISSPNPMASSTPGTDAAISDIMSCEA